MQSFGQNGYTLCKGIIQLLATDRQSHAADTQTDRDRQTDRADRQRTCIRTTSYCQLESYLFTDCLPFSRVDNDDDGDELRRRLRLRPRCAGCQIALSECAEVRVVRGSFPIGGVTRLPQLCLALLASIFPVCGGVRHASW